MKKTQEEVKVETEAGEDTLAYNEIDKLQNMGINAGDITKLKAAGSSRDFQ